MEIKNNVEFITPSGSAIKDIYSSKVLDDGTVELVKTGEENFNDYIQSFRDSVDIGVILKKAVMGDLSGLQRVQGFYADTTKFPKTKAEMLQIVMDAQSNFEKLPNEIREKFDYDFNKFFATMDTPEWLEKMKMNKTEEKVMANEQEQ